MKESRCEGYDVQLPQEPVDWITVMVQWMILLACFLFPFVAEILLFGTDVKCFWSGITSAAIIPKVLGSDPSW